MFVWEYTDSGIIRSGGQPARKTSTGCGTSQGATSEEASWDRDYRTNSDTDGIMLIQGSLVNTAERTFIFYGATTPTGDVAGSRVNVGVATLPRDRFVYLQIIPDAPGGGFFATRPLTRDTDLELFVNADVPEGSSLRCSLLDADGLDTLPGYGFEDLAEPVGSGLNTPVRWRGRASLPRREAFRIRVEFLGKNRVYALSIR